MSDLSRATSIFLDLFQCSRGAADLKRLGDIASGFAHLPWENLTKFLKKHRASGTDRLRLSEEVLADHARLGAGGTCFSLTNALRRIVTDLGFQARPVMADMRHGANIHCGLRIDLDGEAWLLDPGYLVAEPVPLRPGRAVRVELPGHTLEYSPVAASDYIELYTSNARGEEQKRYRLRTGPVSDAEFVRHWVASFDANGMNGLHLNRITGEGRLSAHDLNLRIDTGRDKVNVKLRDGYARKVAERFGLDERLAERAFAEWERLRCGRR